MKNNTLFIPDSFIIAGIIFTALSIWTIFTSYKQILEFKKGKLEVNDNNKTEKATSKVD